MKRILGTVRFSKQSRHHMQVIVVDTKKEFLRFGRTELRCARAACIIFKKKKRNGCIGQLVFISRYVNAKDVVHECSHAAFDYTFCSVIPRQKITGTKTYFRATESIATATDHLYGKTVKLLTDKKVGQFAKWAPL